MAAIATAGLGLRTSQSNAQPEGAQAEASVEQFTLHFSTVQAEGRLKTLLQQHSLAPFGVFMTLDDQYGRHYVRPEKASVAVIDAARSTSREMENKYGKSLTVRAKLAAEGKLPQQAQERIAAANERRQNRSTALDRGRPIIYGLWVAGSKASADAISRVPGVTVTPAHPLQGRTILEDPKIPSTRAPGA